MIVAILIDRSAFLKKGLLPIGSFFAALPIVGIAPIMVNWFGFDWHSKSAVVVVMVFFPVLINTVEGLQSTQSIHRDLMRTYAASKTQALFKLRLPAAMPFVFNGLKIAMTLGLDWCHPGGIFRFTDARDGVSHLHRRRKSVHPPGLGRDRGRGACRGYDVRLYGIP